MNVEYVRQTLDECNDFITQSANAPWEPNDNHYAVEIRKLRSAVFTLMQGMEEMLKGCVYEQPSDTLPPPQATQE